MRSNDSKSTASIGFCGLLTIAFIILKLTGVIEWSWVWIVAPIWIPVLLGVILLMVGCLIEHFIK